MPASPTFDPTRRRDLQRMTPLEQNIRHLVLEVEKVGADVRLTDCVVLLQDAHDRLADYIDGVNPETTYGHVSQHERDEIGRSEWAKGFAAAATAGAAASSALREAAENALASLDNVLSHHGKDMYPGDLSARKRVAEALREALGAAR